MSSFINKSYIKQQMKFKILKYLKNNKKYYGLEIIAYDKNKAHEYIHPKYKINPTELTKQIQVIYNYTAQFVNGMLQTMFKMAFFSNSCIDTENGILFTYFPRSC